MKKDKQKDSLLKEVIAIKKLLALKLLRDGFTQTQIGLALDIDQSEISRMFPVKAYKLKGKP